MKRTNEYNLRPRKIPNICNEIDNFLANDDNFESSCSDKKCDGECLSKPKFNFFGSTDGNWNGGNSSYSEYDKYDIFMNFDDKGISFTTGTKWNTRGFDYDHNHVLTSKKCDHHGFDFRGIHNITQKHYNERNFDYKGNYIKFEGIKFTGIKYDPRGFDIDKNHYITGTKYDTRGFDVNGIHISGIRKNENGLTYNGNPDFTYLP